MIHKISKKRRCLFAAFVFSFAVNTYGQNPCSFCDILFIPDVINWEHPEGLSDTNRIMSSIATIYFAKDNTFYILYSNVGKPKGDDSLIFEYEPGYLFQSGKWRTKDSKKIALYFYGKEKKVLKKEGKYPQYAEVNITKENFFLFFDGKQYIVTSSYDMKSKQRIMSYMKNMFLERLFRHSN